MTVFAITPWIDAVTSVVAIGSHSQADTELRLIAGVAVVATGFALRQAITGRGNGFAIFLTAILVALQLLRVILNLQNFRSPMVTESR